MQLILTIFSAVVSAIVTWLVEYLLDQKDYLHAPPDRLKKLVQTDWQGHFRQKDPTDATLLRSFDFNITLSSRGKKIFGEAIAIHERNSQNVPIVFELRQGVFDGVVLKINYANKKKSIFQKGTIILKFNSEGNYLDGGFAGYSPTFESVIFGEVQLKPL